MSDSTDRLYETVLVLRCQAGDEAAFAELVERYQPRLRYYLRKMLHDLQGAEDALQDVWLDVFRAVSRLAEVAAFRAWLYRIARDRALREFRKRRPLLQALEELDPVDGQAEEEHFTAEDVEHIHAALDELPAEQREVLVLRYIETMTYEAIAQVVGCRVGTVRSRLHYAKRALRAVLERKSLHD
jgi:RNA polymerase sigma-70 factor, ECF subfamily